MDSEIANLLKENDTIRRREGIIRAARSGDPSYIYILDEKCMSETDPDLQALINRALIYLQNNNAQLPDQSAVPQNPLASAPIPTHPLPAPKTNDSRTAKRATSASPDTLQRSLWQNQFDIKLASAVAVPGTPLGANERLTGKVYNTRVSALTRYLVVEPNANPEPAGWPVLFVLHGWMGNGLSEIPTYADQAAHDGIILVGPTFDHASNPSYEAVYHDIRVILGQIKAHYRVDWRASVLAGFSWGGRVAQFYSVVYIKDFGGAVVGGSREYMTVPSNSLLRYAIFVGTTDFLDDVDRSKLAQAFVASMAQAGKPVWYFENSPGVGHQLVPEQVNKTFELIAFLRSHH
jgi:pimeloyl-ACP methyl ester carboxylesterase